MVEVENRKRKFIIISSVIIAFLLVGTLVLCLALKVYADRLVFYFAQKEDSNNLESVIHYLPFSFVEKGIKTALSKSENPETIRSMLLALRSAGLSLEDFEKIKLSLNDCLAHEDKGIRHICLILLTGSKFYSPIFQKNIEGILNDQNHSLVSRDMAGILLIKYQEYEDEDLHEIGKTMKSIRSKINQAP